MSHTKKPPPLPPSSPSAARKNNFVFGQKKERKEGFSHPHPVPLRLVWKAKQETRQESFFALSILSSPPNSAEDENGVLRKTREEKQEVATNAFRFVVDSVESVEVPGVDNGKQEPGGR